MMENQQASIGSLIESAGDYLETRMDLLKLQAVNRSSDVASSIVSGATIALSILFAITVLNIGLSLWVGELLGTTYLGFFVVTGFYIVLALLLYIFRHAWLKGPVSNKIIKKMLN